MINRVWLVSILLMISIINTVDGQCAGTVLHIFANDSYQNVESNNYPFNYGNNLNCVWRIQAANDTDAIRLEITDAVIEYHADCVYDYGQVFDGYNSSSSSLGKFCGTGTPNYVTSGNYMTITFISDYSLSGRGFKARYKSGERSSLLDPDDSDSNLDTIAILGASIGAVVLVIIIMAAIFTYIQAKKAKEIRRNPHLRSVVATSRIEPFRYDYGPNDIWGPPPPPPYGDVYSSPFSPPPAYSEMDPNPQQEHQLPGCTQTESGENSDQPVNRSTENSDNPNTASNSDRINEGQDSNANTRFIRSPNPTANPVPLQGTRLNSTNSIRRNEPLIRTLNTNPPVPPATNTRPAATRRLSVNNSNPARVQRSPRVNVTVTSPPESQNQQPSLPNTVPQTSLPGENSLPKQNTQTTTTEAPVANQNTRTATTEAPVANQNTRTTTTEAPVANQTRLVNNTVPNRRQSLAARSAHSNVSQNNNNILQPNLQHRRTSSNISDISLV